MKVLWAIAATVLLLVFLPGGCGSDDGADTDGDLRDGDIPDGDTSDNPEDDPDGEPADGDIPSDGDSPLPDGDSIPSDGDITPDGDTLPDGDINPPDGDAPPDGDSADGDIPDGDEIETCGFEYPFAYAPAAPAMPSPRRVPRPSDLPEGRIAHAEPEPPYLWRRLAGTRTDDIVLPGYADTMPPFERGTPWDADTRCYELDTGARLLTEDAAFDLYASLVEKTLWQSVNRTPGHRTVVGLRGAYPGTFEWHGNLPNRFNDTLVLLWIDPDGSKRVREHAAHTDTGAYDFGIDSSSSLYPNRRYRYANGWHRSYNALQIQEWNYMVRDDGNTNGHWDSDRNGWLEPFSVEDRYRIGSAHNIHAASVNGPLWTAQVGVWSAGCQTIPGMVNWLAFIEDAWTEEGDAVDYYLIDARDIAPDWRKPCSQPNGTHACPIPIREFPYSHHGDTSASQERWFDVYNCSSANESGPELVYVLNLDRAGTLSITVTPENSAAADPDIHLLEGDDADACRARAHTSLQEEVWPGRYLIIVDTWVNGAETELAGPYRLDVDFD